MNMAAIQKKKKERKNTQGERKKERRKTDRQTTQRKTENRECMCMCTCMCVLVTYIQRKSDRLKQKERHKKYIDSKRKQIYGLRVVAVLRRASCTSKRKRAHMDLIRRHRES